MWLCSPLCVSPPGWQMHLLRKSWWIFSLNFKSKPHLPSLFLTARALHVYHASCLAQPSFIDKAAMEENIALDSYLRHMLIPCDEWEQHILVYGYASYQMSLEYVVFCYLCHATGFPLTNYVAITFSVSLCFSSLHLKLPQFLSLCIYLSLPRLFFSTVSLAQHHC